MPGGSVTVLGGGVAGLSAALLLARDGRAVRLVERDPFLLGEPGSVFDWPRRGIPHFLLPHAFIPRGRQELALHFPEVYRDLLDAGAWEVDLAPKLPGPTVAGDEELRYLAVRRPLIEWALRRAVAREERVEVHAGVQVQGLQVERGRVRGVRIDGSVLDADVVVDALGRRSPVATWLAAAGIDQPPLETSDCGVVVYSRYYRQRPGYELPDGPWFLSPRGDLGYLGFSSFPGDNRTFAAVLAVPSGVPEWRVFRERAAFEAAVSRIPALRTWVDPDGVEPITDVMAMGGLRNSLRSGEAAAAAGVALAGDTFSHTDPALAHGLAFSLVAAIELTASLQDHADPIQALSAYAHSMLPALSERFAFCSQFDEQRKRGWLGGEVDASRADGDYALFCMQAGAIAATTDPEICRVHLRRIGLLDRTGVLDQNPELQRRMEVIAARALSAPRPPAGPDREEMLALTAAAA